MKNLLKWGLLASLSIFTLTGCSSEDAVEDVLGTDPDTPVDEIATINLTEGGAATDEFYALALGEAGETVKARVIFKTNGGTQRRLYVTQTLPGGSSESEVFVVEGLTNKELKADGSIDLDGEAKEGFDFTFDLNVPSNVNDGSIIYNFWSTNGKGDFRDTQNSFLIGVGTIEVKVGTGVNSADAVRSFTQTLLQVPTGDGTSETFISLFDGETYKLSEGEEVAALWDFGYYYGATNKASLASTSGYPALFNHDDDINTPNIAISELTGINESEFNNFYITQSAFTSADFDGITLSQLDGIAEQFTQQVVTGLKVGDVLEFIDNYGAKGLIRIVEINGTFNQNDYITFDIKMQPYAPILN